MALDFRTRPQITLTKMIKIQSFKKIKINLINYLFQYLHVHLYSFFLYTNIMQLILFYVRKQDEIIFNRPDLFGTQNEAYAQYTTLILFKKYNLNIVKILAVNGGQIWYIHVHVLCTNRFRLLYTSMF